MALHAIIDIPRFLHEDSLHHDVDKKLDAINSKYTYSTSDIEKAKSNLYDVLAEEVTSNLKEQEILWTFGAETARKEVERDTDVRTHKVTLEISDDVIHTINEVVQTALFIVTSALESLINKQSRKY